MTFKVTLLSIFYTLSAEGEIQMRNVCIAASMALAMTTVVAQADPAYKAEQIVQHFIKSAKLGEAKAICIGTDQECKAKAEAPLEEIDMRVNFELNSAQLTPDARETLQQFATAFNDPRLEIATFEVDGHTDARGTKIFNDELSVERAKTVAETLVGLGVSKDRIKTHGYGMSKPLGSDPFADVNRRVEARMVMPKD
ncbi:OmpA family protein [Mesorhizobium amorphae]